ncbi:MAG: glyoxylate/hydroxypyruvate reductase A [Gammaproteobacteria bacterium]|jgi:glyoxylate/hydroxypyruvate reductase A|nr:glyoxylate/hydroxypyruvate reductase A [Gammaproteobacteria bacterium]
MAIECPIYLTADNTQQWIDAFARQYPHIKVLDWQHASRPADVRYAIVWQPCGEFFQRFPNLEAVFNLGAGVDGILCHPQLPREVQVIRLENAGMAAQMNQYFAYHIMHFHRSMDTYQRQQSQQHWQSHPGTPAGDFRVGILGLGQLGSSVADCLFKLGYKVSGWSQSEKYIEGVQCFQGADQLNDFLQQTDALCCLLPLTDNTRDLLNRHTMGQLPAGAVIINAARGEHLVEDDLLELLDSGHLRGAVLDTVRNEPLAADSSLWRQAGLIITPHCAAQSWIEPTVKQIGNNIDTLLAGKTPTGLVERNRGY